MNVIKESLPTAVIRPEQRRARRTRDSDKGGLTAGAISRSFFDYIIAVYSPLYLNVTNTEHLYGPQKLLCATFNFEIAPV